MTLISCVALLHVQERPVIDRKRSMLALLTVQFFQQDLHLAKVCEPSAPNFGRVYMLW